MSEPSLEPAPLPPPEEEGDLQRLSPLTPVARSGIFLVVAAYAGGREVLQEGRLAGLAIGIGAVLVLGAAFGFASWYRTFFRITATELRIDTGIVSRRSRRVRLDRVLEVGIEQPFIARVLGLAELRIETATSDSEVKLAYLTKPEAHRVREVLLAQRAAVRRAEGAATTDGAPDLGDTSIAAGAPEGRLLLHVPIRWQLIGLVASPETVAIVLLFLAIAGLVVGGVPFGAFGVGLATALGTVLSLARKVVGWWDWKISAVPTGLQVRHGMFSLSTRTFNVERLQGVRITEPFLQRPFGMARLDLSVAGGGISDGGENDSTGIAVPVAPREIVHRLAADLIGASAEDIELSLPPSRARWLTPFWRRGLGFGMDDRVAVSTRGLLSRRIDVVPLARIQSFRVTRGPLQRLLRLATVHGDSPVGLVDLQARHRDPAVARQALAEGVEKARVARMPEATIPTTLQG